MEISLKANYGFELNFKADNVSVTECIEDNIYNKTPEGKTDFTKGPLRDISDDIIQQFSGLLDDMIYYRQREFDSSELIERLFKKLPQEVGNKLIVKLKEYYDVNAE